jgi:3-dehydroquinate dehydratase-2
MARRPEGKTAKRKATAGSQRPRILVLHGPNLNLLGEREPEIYGTLTLDEINGRIREAAAALGVAVEIRQSNHEGVLIDAIHAARGRALGVVINPGAYAHTSLAIADAIRSTSLPAFEVHISNVFAREEFRRALVIAPAAKAVVSGMGWRGYVIALREIARMAGIE